ncbi:MAG: hypothetical protein AAGC55_24105 [Myxococcota bacterium]
MATQFVVRIAGRLQFDEAKELSDELLAEVRASGLKSFDITFDLGELKQCTGDARAVLCKLQMLLVSHGARTRYVAHVPREREREART